MATPETGTLNSSPLGLYRLKAVTPGQTKGLNYSHWLATVDEGSGSSMDLRLLCSTVVGTLQ